MSLLLDALKKAAEQKAEKSKEDTPQRPSDETVVDAAGDISELEGDDDSELQAPRPGSHDETELDHSELEARLERTQAAAPAEGRDDTGIDVPDQTETEAEA